MRDTEEPDIHALLKELSELQLKSGVSLHGEYDNETNTYTLSIDFSGLLATLQEHEQVRSFQSQPALVKVTPVLDDKGVPSVQETIEELQVNDTNGVPADAIIAHRHKYGVSPEETRDRIAWLAKHGWIYRQGDGLYRVA